MTWNWEKPDWPNFTYDSGALEPLEKEFRLRSSELIGACKQIGAEDQAALKIDLINDEAVKTSEIEGEILDRANVQVSSGWGTWIRTKINGVRVHHSALIRQRFFSKQEERRTCNIKRLNLIFKIGGAPRLASKMERPRTLPTSTA